MASCVFIAGCSSSTRSDGGTTDGTANADNGSPVDASRIPPWDQCTQIETELPEVWEAVGSGTAPLPAGGELRDGTYVLTSAEIYGESAYNPDVQRDVYVFAGPRFQLRREYSATSGMFVTSSTRLSLSSTCRCGDVGGSCTAAPTTRNVFYTATETKLVIILDVAGGGTGVWTYTKQ